MKLGLLLWMTSVMPQPVADQTCLAATVYLEARGESTRGQMAVAEVGLHRQRIDLLRHFLEAVRAALLVDDLHRGRLRHRDDDDLGFRRLRLGAGLRQVDLVLLRRLKHELQLGVDFRLRQFVEGLARFPSRRVLRGEFGPRPVAAQAGVLLRHVVLQELGHLLAAFVQEHGVGLAVLVARLLVLPDEVAIQGAEVPGLLRLLLLLGVRRRGHQHEDERDPPHSGVGIQNATPAVVTMLLV